VNASDWKKRSGVMDEGLPQYLGHEAAGVVDEVGGSVTDVGVGDRVVGFSAAGAAQAEKSVLNQWVAIPEAMSFVDAAALPAVVETAARALDRLGVAGGNTLLITGASGSVGSAAVQFAVRRGARVIGAGSPATHDWLRSLGAEPVAYGEEMVDAVRALAPEGVDLALDVAGAGDLADLIALTGGSTDAVVTVADVAGADEHGVHFCSGADGRADHALGGTVRLATTGAFRIAVERTFPLADVAEAHRLGEAGEVRGKIVLTVE
jgi:NADPH:quinone reductase-like Zn-dependent oxidoreductase